MSQQSDKIKRLLEDELGVNADDVTNDANLRDDLDMNELDIVEMVMSLEEEFGIEIEDEDCDQFVLVGDVVKYIERRNTR